MKFIVYIAFMAFGFALAAVVPNKPNTIDLLYPNESRPITDCPARCAVFGYNNGALGHSVSGGVCICTGLKTP